MTPAPAPFRPLTGTLPAAGLVSLALLPVLFALDQYLPLGVAAGIAYVIPVLLTLWSSRRLTLAVAGIASLLVLADLLLAPAAALNWMVALNRALALLMIWTTAILVLLRRHAELAVETANAALERQVQARTAHLDEVNRQLQREIAERAGAEAALRESEHHLRRIIDLVPHRIFAKDDEGRFLLANRAVAEAYGMAVEDILGRHHGELHGHAQELERMRADDRAVMESGEMKVIPEEAFTGRDGRTRILRTVKIPYRVPGDRRRAVLGLAIDITEEKEFERRLLASERKYRALLENAVDAILLATEDGWVLDANRRAEQLLGYSRDELCGMHARDLHPAEEHARLAEVFETLRRSGNTLVVHPVRRRDGGIIQVEVAASRIDSGGETLIQGIFRDVSTRERRTAQRLAEEKRLRDTLVREVHHRIKNNLQGVIGLLRAHADVTPALAEAIAAAIGQIQAIAVVHGLYGRGNDLQVHLCDMVRAIVRNACALTRAQIEPLVEIAVQRPLAVHPDEAVPVALIVNELILNAVKHSSGGEEAGITVRLSQSEGVAQVVVSNPGILPPSFNFPAGRGLGTGLELVCSLLPRGGRLEFRQVGGTVHALLDLTAPVAVPVA